MTKGTVQALHFSFVIRHSSFNHSPMSRRSRAREVALQILFEDDVNPRASVADTKKFLSGRLNSPELEEFCLSLILGVRRNQQELDELLTKTADNWSLGRMAATDRNVLRLGAYEILYTDTPDRAAINEAVELAKRFGSAQSAQFVNGILDKFLHRKNGQ
jgi:N utilization substance protein B